MNKKHQSDLKKSSSEVKIVFKQTKLYREKFEQEIDQIRKVSWKLEEVRKQNIIMWRELKNLKIAKELITKAVVLAKKV